MLYKVKGLNDYKLKVMDGEIGKLKEFYFDDRLWTVRYLSVETDHWLSERQVLISPFAIISVINDKKRININLTKKKIEDSPYLSIAKPISRRYEEAYNSYYGWPVYWRGSVQWGSSPFMMHEKENRNESAGAEEIWSPGLRSIGGLNGHSTHDLDGEIGHIEDFIIDDDTWVIRYLLIDTQKTLPVKRILVSPKWINRISPDEPKMFVGLHRGVIRQSLDYTEESMITRNYERDPFRLSKYLDRKFVNL